MLSGGRIWNEPRYKWLGSYLLFQCFYIAKWLGWLGWGTHLARHSMALDRRSHRRLRPLFRKRCWVLMEWSISHWNIVPS